MYVMKKTQSTNYFLSINAGSFFKPFGEEAYLYVVKGRSAAGLRTIDTRPKSEAVDIDALLGEEEDHAL